MMRIPALKVDLILYEYADPLSLSIVVAVIIRRIELPTQIFLSIYYYLSSFHP